MGSKATRQFWRLFSDLPSGTQRDARRVYQLFKTNPSHPSLQLKRVGGEDDIHSVRIGLNYRALSVMRKDHVVWYWIGSHADYDRLL